MHNISEKILEIYSKHPKWTQEYNFCKHKTNTLEVTLAKIGTILLPDYSLESFESIQAPATFQLSKILAFIPPKKLVEEFGQQALFWIWDKHTDTVQHEKLQTAYSKISRVAEIVLEQARTTMHARIYGPNNNDSVCLWKMVQTMQGIDSALNKINLSQELLKHSNNNNISKKIHKYSLQVLRLEHIDKDGGGYNDYWRKKHALPVSENELATFKIHMSTPIGIALMYDNVPVFMTTFKVTDRETLTTYQIQGVAEKIINNKLEVVKSNQTRGISGLDPQLIVSINEQISKYMGFNRHAILSAQNIFWANPSNTNGEIHLPLERGLKMYDETAQKRGYTQASNQNWYKKV